MKNLSKIKLTHIIGLYILQMTTSLMSTISGIGIGALGENTFDSSSHVEDSFVHLIEQSKKGDHVAFGHIYDALHADVYRYIYFKVPGHEVSDITSDIFLKVWEKIHLFKGETKGKFRSWVFTIAHNLVVDFYRARKETTALDEVINIPKEVAIDDPEVALEHTFSAELIAQALSELSEDYKEIVTLRYIHDFSNKEISSILKKREGSVRITLHRALKKLEDILRAKEG